jgi:hypothetical protein
VAGRAAAQRLDLDRFIAEDDEKTAALLEELGL